jgi:hypothetical protein
MPGRGDHLVGRRGLRDESARAGFQSAEKLVIAGVHGEHDDAESVARLPQCPGGFQTAAVRKAEIHDHDIGL